MNDDQRQVDERDLNQWLFGRRRPRHRGRVWTSASSRKERE